jgi:hypothetical protein
MKRKNSEVHGYCNQAALAFVLHTLIVEPFAHAKANSHLDEVLSPARSDAGAAFLAGA